MGPTLKNLMKCKRNYYLPSVKTKLSGTTITRTNNIKIPLFFFPFISYYYKWPLKKILFSIFWLTGKLLLPITN